MVLSFRVNIPMIMAIEERTDSITILEELLPNTKLDKFYVSDITDYKQIKSGEIIPDIGMKMIDFTSNHINNVVTSAIKINPESKVKSVVIKLVDNKNSDLIATTLQNVLKSLPTIQPEVIQIVFNYVLSKTSILTPDYSYDGPLTWSMCVYYTTNTTNTTNNNTTNNNTNTYYTKNNLDPNL